MRIRSRPVETESVNPRLLRRRSVTRTAIGARAVGPDEMMPVAPSRRISSPTLIAITQVGETVTVSRASQAVADTGTAVEWDTIESVPRRSGFDGLEVPTEVLTQSVAPAYYDLHLSFGWDSYTDPWTVNVEIDGTVVQTVSGSGPFRGVLPLGVNVTDEVPADA
jgi:hypothetical protein